MGLRDHVVRQHEEQPGGQWAGSFMAEGDLVIERGLRAGHTLRSVLVDGRRPAPGCIPDDIAVFAADSTVLSAVAGRTKLRDAIACFARPHLPTAEAVLNGARAVAVLENVNNPNNMGVIMRCAAGLGIDAVLLDPSCCDPFYRRAIRASMGEAFAIPHARLDAFPLGLETVTAAGVRILAMTPGPSASALSEVQLDADEPIGILLGAEGPGLTETTLAATSEHVAIPMAASVDSLNVAAAAAIAFHAVGVGR